MCAETRFEVAPPGLAALVERLRGRRRVLVCGAPGTGKSTVSAGLASAFAHAGQATSGIGADPGSPAGGGVPGALSLSRWGAGAGCRFELEPLCTLDAGRFRLPLVRALARLVARAPPGMVLVDTPGVVRGAAGAELLLGMADAVEPDAVVVLARDVCAPPLEGELAALAARVWVAPAPVAAHRPGKAERTRRRSLLWNRYLERAFEQRLDLERLACVGMPPPPTARQQWVGRQAALLRGGTAVAFGEVRRLEEGVVTARLRTVSSAAPGGPEALLVRDARRHDAGLLETAAPAERGGRHFDAYRADAASGPLPAATAPRAARSPRPYVVRTSRAEATLVNGLFGDPLLYVRLANRRRSMLFDLGEAVRLPARSAHRVAHVFVSHAHADHFSGFGWLLRSRIGVEWPCRLFGPPGLALNVAGFVNGFHWDRIGDRGPRFEVAEVHEDGLRRYAVQAGGAREPRPLGREPFISGGALVDERRFRVRAALLDHGTPVLAYAFEPKAEVHVREEPLAASGLAPGPWLAELKARAGEGARAERVALPDGTRRSVAELAERLLEIRTHRALVYATDLADTAENRQRVLALARGAETLICEATFCDADAEKAVRTGHLTARACGEIAAAAGVERLLPFHFSRRYEADPERLYAEVRARYDGIVLRPDA